MTLVFTGKFMSAVFKPYKLVNLNELFAVPPQYINIYISSSFNKDSLQYTNQTNIA